MKDPILFERRGATLTQIAARDVGTGQVFFFDTYDGRKLYADSEGTRCADLQGVRTELMRVLLEVALDNFATDDASRVLTVIARSGEQKVVSEMSLAFHSS